ncbi:MAG: hypothetical protein Q9Q40_14880 [Acidobacteriota bacterium]|nr:hypothetical protein [Acidobacteriota bacterium]MDQ7086882.1 hypothetical protein [Acidobacteriota bacterium]
MEDRQMLRKTARWIVGFGLLVLLAATPAPASEPFDLKVDLDLGPAVTGMLQEGDTLQVILRPEIQYGQRTAAGQPLVMERNFTPGTLVEHIRFDKALAPNQIYRLELRIVRRDAKGREHSVRYLSALAKLPRRPVDQAIPMRLHRGHKRDTRANHVMVVRDQDGVYRVMVFTA